MFSQVIFLHMTKIIHFFSALNIYCIERYNMQPKHKTLKTLVCRALDSLSVPLVFSTFWLPMYCFLTSLWKVGFSFFIHPDLIYIYMWVFEDIIYSEFAATNLCKGFLLDYVFRRSWYEQGNGNWDSDQRSPFCWDGATRHGWIQERTRLRWSELWMH